MVGEDRREGNQQDSADASQDTPVPATVEQTAAEQEHAARHQKECARQKRIANIAKRRRSKRRRAYVKPVIESLAGLATVGILIFTGVYAHYAKKQWTEMQKQSASLAQQVADQQKSFNATWRAAIYAGLPNGQVGEFAHHRKTDKTDRVILHFRNYGQSTAENTVIELWSAVAVSDKPATVIDIPAFQGFPSEGPRLAGISIPPGFPIIAVTAVTVEDRKLIDDDKAMLAIEGRLSYVDAFGQYCQPFSIQYDQVAGFHLGTTPMKPICGGKPQQSIFGRVTVGTKWKRVFPFKIAEPSATWTPPPHDAAHTEQ